MSERTGWTLYFCVAMLVIVAVIGGGWERRWGRAEMKHWQDDWYAAHPVVIERVKEVATNCEKEFEPFREGERKAIRELDLIPRSQCAPKPQKGTNGGNKWYDYYLRGYEAALFDQQQMRKLTQPTIPGTVIDPMEHVECFDTKTRKMVKGYDCVTPIVCTSGIPPQCGPAAQPPENKPQ